MAHNIRAARTLFRQNNLRILQTLFRTPQNPNSQTSTTGCRLGIIELTRFLHSPPEAPPATFLQNLLKFRRDKPTDQVERALELCGFHLNDDLVLDVLRRHRTDWKLALVFFNWASKSNVYTPSSRIWNEILNILGKMKRFEELHQVFDEMSKREVLIDEQVFATLIRRYAGAHKVEEAIALFHKRDEFGFHIVEEEAFQTLLMWLCRCKHVEEAETLFHSKVKELKIRPDIKTWNLILNGWCVLGNEREAKRVWKDIVASKCKPDLFTYSTFIKALTKKGKLGTALRLFRGMWDGDCDFKPCVVICNCMIDALCFKKRIPEALEIFHAMKERGCEPNAATYNSLIKHLCKIRRMEKAYELVDEMERRKGSCLPDDVTFSYLLRSLKEPEEVPSVLERMERNGCNMNDDICNLVLRLYMEWDDHDGMRRTWEEMERNGWGPDKRSYRIMVHGHFEKGRVKDAMRYFREMTSKGIVPEPMTEKLVNDKSKERTERQ